jgi:hypothetical protein
LYYLRLKRSKGIKKKVKKELKDENTETKLMERL